MKTTRLFLDSVLALALLATLPGCPRAGSTLDGVEYLKSKGFGPVLMAQVRYGPVLKNTNQQFPGILQALHEIEVVSTRRIDPVYTIYLEKGSSFRSETISIEVGEDGYGAIRHPMHATLFFHCAKLPASARAAFDQSTVILHPTPVR